MRTHDDCTHKHRSFTAAQRCARGIVYRAHMAQLAERYVTMLTQTLDITEDQLRDALNHPTVRNA